MFLDRLEHLAGLKNAAIVVHVLIGQFGGVKIPVGLPNQLGEAQVQLGAEGPIGEGKSSLAIFAEQTDRQGFDQRVIQGFRVVQRLLGLLTMANVARDAESADDGAPGRAAAPSWSRPRSLGHPANVPLLAPTNGFPVRITSCSSR